MLSGDVKIEVPSMGDSISEGTVASVAKQAGERHHACTASMAHSTSG